LQSYPPAGINPRTQENDMNAADTLYDHLARIWGITRKAAKLRAYRAAFGIATAHPEADRALISWLLTPDPVMKAATFHERYGFTTYGKDYPTL
jgi:hypothetical protein